MTEFVPLPCTESLRAVWPTPGRVLARTRANPDYGKPGWSRDCGKRFHRGCDIAPVSVTPTGQSTVVQFTDCATGREYASTEPIYVPHDPVMCVYPGVVQEAVTDEAVSDFGRHVVVAHRWPDSGDGFLSLYGHLAAVEVGVGQRVAAGQRLGWMGQSSRIADARNWMLVAPHLHFEIRTGDGTANFDPLAFLDRFAAEGSAH